MHKKILSHYDLVVIGGGAGGTGAALTAARLGLRTLWLEKEQTLGGTGVHSFVCVWQPSVSQSSLAREIAERLVASGQGHYVGPDENTPSGRPIYKHISRAGYNDTLCRWADGARKQLAPALAYQPEAMSALLADMAQAETYLHVMTNAPFLYAVTSKARDGLRQITQLVFAYNGTPYSVTAGYVIDATADLAVAQNVGCAVSWGQESQEMYGEPSAPITSQWRLNGWTLCFIVQPGPDKIILSEAGRGPNSDWAHICALPDGGFVVNLCFQLSGEEGWRLGLEQAREWLCANIARRWPQVRAAYGLQDYGINMLAPRVGIREGPRLKGRYVLTELDIRRGDWGRHHPDCIAWTDHAMDRHAAEGGCLEAPNGPFGIPLRCLQPREITNLLVACRGASFSSLAASAARLQRTIMELGEAAARYVASQ